MDRIAIRLDCAQQAGAGTRNLLHSDWCAELAGQVKSHASLVACLPGDAVAVQCTYFDKSEQNNWLVTLHRDQFIPIKHKVDAARWSNWSIKEGVTFVRPPRSVLEKLVAVRLSVDGSDHSNGPLQVVPGSHVGSGEESNRITVCVERGAALVFKPLLLHASSKVKRGRRRVLHFLFGPALLADGVEWNDAV